MALPVRAKLNLALASLYCFILSVLLLVDPSLVVDNSVMRSLAQYTGLPRNVVGEEVRDAYAFGSYGVFIVGMSYALAVWGDNELFVRNAVYVRIAVGLWGLMEVFLVGVGGITIFAASVADLLAAVSLIAALRAGDREAAKGKRRA